MDGENNGKPLKMDALRGKPTIFGNTRISCNIVRWLLALPPNWNAMPNSRIQFNLAPTSLQEGGANVHNWRSCWIPCRDLSDKFKLHLLICWQQWRKLCTVFEKLNRPSRSKEISLFLLHKLCQNKSVIETFLFLLCIFGKQTLSYDISDVHPKKIVATTTPQRWLGPFNKSHLMKSWFFFTRNLIHRPWKSWKKQTYRLLKIFPSKSTNACSCVFQRLSTCLCLVISKRNLFMSILMLISKDICI